MTSGITMTESKNSIPSVRMCWPQLSRELTTIRILNPQLTQIGFRAKMTSQILELWTFSIVHKKEWRQYKIKVLLPILKVGMQGERQSRRRLRPKPSMRKE